MFTVFTVLRKKPTVTTADFRHFMTNVYGPTYQAMPQTRSYVQRFLTDLADDGAEPPIDAIMEISFDSEAEMRTALDVDSYRKAAVARAEYLRETSVGTHSGILDNTVRLV
jgi:uncharacterized protein (TIGR02118 family)